jgi:hypothetical protein
MISLGKVTSTHLKRNAYLYIRQSSLKQVVANKESGQRQYALTERAVVLGWHEITPIGTACWRSVRWLVH